MSEHNSHSLLPFSTISLAATNKPKAQEHLSRLPYTRMLKEYFR